jgi:hypothetical protein
MLTIWCLCVHSAGASTCLHPFDQKKLPCQDFLSLVCLFSALEGLSLISTVCPQEFMCWKLNPQSHIWGGDCVTVHGWMDEWGSGFCITVSSLTHACSLVMLQCSRKALTRCGHLDIRFPRLQNHELSLLFTNCSLVRVKHYCFPVGQGGNVEPPEVAVRSIAGLVLTPGRPQRHADLRSLQI